MTNDQYIAALNKALSGLDSASRRDIVQEIQSHEAESGSSLLERFGDPTMLAEQYLEGETISPSVAQKAGGFGKKMFLWVGILASTMVVAMMLFIWTASSDDFDYSNEMAEELDQTSADWVTKPWAEGMSIAIDQSSAVIYWHDDSTVRWQCNSSEAPVIDAEKLSIRQSRCLLMVPKTALKLTTDQAQVVLVRPQSSINLDITQTSLRVAENDTQYRFEVNKNRSNFSGLSSFDDAEHTITIKSQESMVSAYEAK